jgi:hypothetical protein
MMMIIEDYAFGCRFSSRIRYLLKGRQVSTRFSVYIDLELVSGIFFFSFSHVVELLKGKIPYHSFYLSSTVVLLFDQSGILPSPTFEMNYTSDFVGGLPGNPAAVESVRQTVGQIGASELGEVGAVEHKHEASAIVITHQ